MSNPIAVIINDIHFSLSTLELASSALRQAREKAFDLGVDLVLAGDTVNDKAIIRAEVANRLIEIFDGPHAPRHTYVIIGNHCQINERSFEHSLNFLKPYVKVVEQPFMTEHLLMMFPYFSDTEKLISAISGLPRKTILIMHQGLQTANAGHYMQDKTALDPSHFDELRVISGHYHRRQDIKCGVSGLFTYTGNPYTLHFGEANDPEKGFHVLYEDGSLEFIPTNLRKHIIASRTIETVLDSVPQYNQGDIVWLKVEGIQSELDKLDKKDIGNKLFGHQNFKLDKIPTHIEKPHQPDAVSMTDAERFDSIIDKCSESLQRKIALKDSWRNIV